MFNVKKPAHILLNFVYACLQICPRSRMKRLTCSIWKQHILWSVSFPLMSLYTSVMLYTSYTILYAHSLHYILWSSFNIKKCWIIMLSVFTCFPYKTIYGVLSDILKQHVIMYFLSILDTHFLLQHNYYSWRGN